MVQVALALLNLRYNMSTRAPAKALHDGIIECRECARCQTAARKRVGRVATLQWTAMTEPGRLSRSRILSGSPEGTGGEE
jgi:hypothetical protein